MKILITGGSGFVGESIVLSLIRAGHELVLLSRNPQKLYDRYGSLVRCYEWDALSGPPEKEAFNGVETIINLMGEGVAEKRWSHAQKQRIYNSRVVGTQYLVDGAKQYAPKLSAFITTSAIGYYDHTVDKALDENAPSSDSFLSKTCQDWEDSAKTIQSNSNVRFVCFRVGVVLGDGGALSKMKDPFLMGLGGQISSGKQWMNWIHRDDLSTLFVSAAQDVSFKGTYNAVSPGNVTNKVFTKALGKALCRPTLFRVPKIALKLLLGGLSQELLEGQKVIPQALLNKNFDFKFTTIEEALEKALNIIYLPHRKQFIRTSRLHVIQYLKQDKQKVFDFFSTAQNLERITPPFLQFKITSQSTPSIQKDTVFHYKLKVRGIPIRWQSLICDWNPIDSFVDTQIKGPYKVWHHTHRFLSIKEGTLIEDDVYFAPPRVPLLGKFITAYVKKDVKKIFDYRKKVIRDLFDREGTLS